MIPEKLCIFCKHCQIADSRGWSEATGAWGAKGLACDAGKFDEYDSESADGEMDSYREFIMQAETCPEYKVIEIRKGVTT